MFSLSSVAAGLGAVFFLAPVLRNQTLDVRDDCLIVRTFGRAFELRPSHLTEVVRHRGGARVYRFQSGSRHYQVTPLAYHDAKTLQREFNRLFDPKKTRLQG